MYCYDCEEFFSEPKAQRELMGECCGQPAYDTFYVCPNCGSHNVENARACTVCGDPTTNKTFCDTCIERARRVRDKFVGRLEKEGALEGDVLDLLLYVVEE